MKTVNSNINIYTKLLNNLRNKFKTISQYQISNLLFKKQIVNSRFPRNSPRNHMNDLLQ